MKLTEVKLTVTIITLNEETNIARALKSASWADEVLVVDAGSTDQTVEIAKKMGARVLTHEWKGYGQQKNLAQAQAKNDWVLSLDADEEVTPALRKEIERCLESVAQTGEAGFWIPRKTWYLNRWVMHGGWYPNSLVRLANRKNARWTEPHVHEELKVEGKLGEIREPILHYSFPSIASQVETNLRFAHLGCQDLQHKGTRSSLPKLLLKPLGKFFETYFIKLGFLDGLAGFVISMNAAHSMFLKYAYLLEQEIRASES